MYCSYFIEFFITYTMRQISIFPQKQFIFFYHARLHYSLHIFNKITWGLCFRVASKIDAVLLSHPDVIHLGALPYAMKHFDLSAPIFSTEPVYRLGLLTMYDHYLSRKVSWICWYMIYAGFWFFPFWFNN